MTDDERLLMESDSLLSLIYNRERHGGLSEQSCREVIDLLRRLRPRTDRIAADTRNAAPDTEGTW